MFRSFKLKFIYISVFLVNGEEYCESEKMLTDETGCKESSCCQWNTWEEGEASYDGAGRCWSAIGRETCDDISGMIIDFS